MKQKHRLAIYERMLNDFMISSGASYAYKQNLNTAHGFCHWLRRHGHHLEKFPELMLTKPNITWIDNLNFWFEMSKVEPRIECLKKAIRLCRWPSFLIKLYKIFV